ncbi:FA32A protein, partial [Polypterus senegalus]
MDSAEDITYFRERVEDLSEEMTMLAALLDSDVDETVFEIIKEQVERTLLHSSSGDSVPCSGRPSFDIPAESIEHLLLCGLKVQQIADLYDVSEKTITRRMSQFDIRKKNKKKESKKHLEQIMTNPNKEEETKKTYMSKRTPAQIAYDKMQEKRAYFSNVSECEWAKDLRWYPEGCRFESRILSLPKQILLCWALERGP